MVVLSLRTVGFVVQILWKKNGDPESLTNYYIVIVVLDLPTGQERTSTGAS